MAHNFDLAELAYEFKVDVQVTEFQLNTQGRDVFIGGEIKLHLHNRI